MPRKTYSNNDVIGMKFVGTWLRPDVHEKLKAIAKEEDRALSYIIARQLNKLADTAPDEPAEPTSGSITAG